MPSVSYGNTLTDLGRNIAEQKASEQALAGLLAQVGAQKLAGLNALAASRGRSQADRDVGMDRNETQRQVAVMESMLRAQELGDRDRQSREGLAAAEAIARLQGANQLELGKLPYSPEALKQLEALARLNAQTLNPRMQETIFAEDAERERQNLRAQSLSMDANRKANLLYQTWITKKASWRPLAFGDSDKVLDEAYQTGINGILSSYGERDAGLVQSMTRPDGRVIFQPMQLPMTRRVPQVQAPATGDSTAIPPPNMAVPVPAAAAAPPTLPMAVPQTGWPTGDANAIPETFAVPSIPQSAPMRVGGASGSWDYADTAVPSVPAPRTRENIPPVDSVDLGGGILQQTAMAILSGAKFKELIPKPIMSGAANRQFEIGSLAKGYVGGLVREASRISGMPANRGSAQRAQLLQSELARVKAILSSQ